MYINITRVCLLKGNNVFSCDVIHVCYVQYARRVIMMWLSQLNDRLTFSLCENDFVVSLKLRTHHGRLDSWLVKSEVKDESLLMGNFKHKMKWETEVYNIFHQ